MKVQNPPYPPFACARLRANEDYREFFARMAVEPTAPAVFYKLGGSLPTMTFGLVIPSSPGTPSSSGRTREFVRSRSAHRPFPTDPALQERLPDGDCHDEVNW